MSEQTSQHTDGTTQGDRRPVAVVTGASSGIGEASARQLAAAGFDVVCAARRTERIEALAAEIGGRAVTCDVTQAEDVERLAREAGDQVDVLFNNAGGALGTETIAEADLEHWRSMYETNVLGALAVTKALLPAVKAAPAGLVVFLTSTAALSTYEGGGGYVAAKHAERVIADTLRLEAVADGVRVSHIAPGMVKTEEFSLVRLGGDAEAAEKVYAGVPNPLTADDIADVVTWIATRPPHVNIDQVTIRPQPQASNYKVHRV